VGPTSAAPAGDVARDGPLLSRLNDRKVRCVKRAMKAVAAVSFPFAALMQIAWRRLMKPIAKVFWFAVKRQNIYT
jgi:hypothetical protein